MDKQIKSPIQRCDGCGEVHEDLLPIEMLKSLGIDIDSMIRNAESKFTKQIIEQYKMLGYLTLALCFVVYLKLISEIVLR